MSIKVRKIVSTLFCTAFILSTMTTVVFAEIPKFKWSKDNLPTSNSSGIYVVYSGGDKTYKAKAGVISTDGFIITSGETNNTYHFAALCYDGNDKRFGIFGYEGSYSNNLSPVDRSRNFIGKVNYGYLTTDTNGYDSTVANGAGAAGTGISGQVSTDLINQTNELALSLLAKELPSNAGDPVLLSTDPNSNNGVKLTICLLKALNINSIDEITLDKIKNCKSSSKWSDISTIISKLSDSNTSNIDMSGIVSSILSDQNPENKWTEIKGIYSGQTVNILQIMVVLSESISADASHSSQLTAPGGSAISNAASASLMHFLKENDEQDSNGDSKLIWKNWYIAALTTAAGIDIDDSTSQLAGIKRYVGGSETSDLLYGSYDILLDMVGNVKSDTEAKFCYEILSLASLSGTESGAFKKWIGNTDYATEIKELAKDMSQNGSNVNYTNLAGWVEEINNAGTSTDTNLKRFTTISQRLHALIAAANTSGFDASDSNFSWISDWYSTSSAWAIDETFFSDAAMPILQTKGSPIYFNIIQGDGQEYIGTYIIHTLYEVPAITQFYLKDMNDIISANTQMTDMTLYKAVKSIKDAKESLDIPLLNLAWDFEVAVPDGVDASTIQYKSLAKIWDKMHELAGDMGDAEDPKEPLATGKPMKWFYKDFQAGILSDYYLQGIAYSAILEPMKSNLYSTEWLRYLDPDFFNKFYYQWGFNRKALYIDKRAGAVETYFTTGTCGIENAKVCTLRDLMTAKNDVLLYIDDNFYNANQMQNRFSVVRDSGERIEIDSVMSGAEGSDVTSQSTAPKSYWWSHMAELIEETYVTDFDKIVKTDSSTNYSKTFYDMMSRLSGAHTYYPDATVDNVGNTDNAVLSSGRINYYLDSENTGSEIYSPAQGYAVVSAVYRDSDLFNKANSRDVQKPVFMASNTAPYMKNATAEACMTIFNYALLQNLEAATPVSFSGNIDMDCPVYMDVFGNIVTESGTVVVPALSNPTLCNKYEYFMNMWGAGLFSVYGLDYYIPVVENRPAIFDNVMASAFTVDDTGKYYIPIPRTVGDTRKIDMSRLSTTDKSTLDTLYSMSYAILYNSSLTGNAFYDFDNYFQVSMEVLRGAPVEDIDKDMEGIDTTNRIDRAGIVAAAKLEELNNSLATNGTNTTLYIPNLAFMPGFNYVAVMAFKVMLLVVIVVNMATIYADAVSESLGFGTAIKCVMAMLITMLVIFTIPAVFEATYYQSNRMLLQDESIKIAMLNQEKVSSGVEIGVTDITEPNVSTKLYIKLEDVKVPWYEMFYDAIFSDSYDTIDSIYKNYAQEHSSVANKDDVQIMNDGVYLDVSDVFNSSSVDLDTTVTDINVRNLVQTAQNQSQTFSWYSPYYAILDALIENVNYYNNDPWEDSAKDINGWYSYSIKELKGGKYKTMGLIAPYFTSNKFLEREGIDPLGLRAIYATRYTGTYTIDPATANFYTESNLQSMRNSGWYAGDISTVELDKRLDYMTEQARRFIANNKDLIGKISDDTFLKAMALDMSLKYNNAFGNKYSSSVEIYNLSNDDLLRLSIADSKNVMINSTLSYPRFVYAVGGSVSVFAAALLSMVMWISGIVKPILVIVAFLTVFISIFIFKVCARRQDVSLWGYFITVLLLSLTNICYSVMLKASMFLPKLGMTPFMCILVQVILQITYLVILLQVVWTAFRDWHDLGFARYANKTHDFRVTLFNYFHRDKSVNNPFYGGTTKSSDPEKNWEYYDNMLDERKRRLR